MIKKFFPISLALLLLDSVRADDSSSCGGSIDNNSQAQEALDAATPMSGDFYITNAGTGGQLIYMHNDQANFAVTTTTITDILNELGGAAGTTASNVITLWESGVNDTVAMMSTASNKCVSAQWGFGSGDCDRFGVAYSCACGPNAVDNPSLNIEKQYWVIVPVNSDSFDSSDPVVSDVETSSDSSSSSSSSTYTGCPKDATWLAEHYWDVQEGGYLDRHPGCTDLMPSSAPSKRMAKRLRNADQPKKRSAQTYMLQAYDHIFDMQSECMTGQQVSAFAGAQSSNLAPCDPTDSNQWWTIVSADDN